MKKVLITLALLPLLSGCAALLGEAALGELAVGVAARGALAEGGFVAASRIAVSEDVAAVAGRVRFSSGLRGPLSQALDSWTRGGSQTGLLEISRRGTISANGYEMARIGTSDGVIYGPRNARLGYLTEDGTMREFLTRGGTRPVGMLRGFTSGSPIAVYDSTGFRRVVGRIPANGVVRVSHFGEQGYLVRLETGQLGWVKAADLHTIVLLGMTQVLANCDGYGGALVTRENDLVRFAKCRNLPGRIVTTGEGGTQSYPTASVAVILHGAIIDPVSEDIRRFMLSSMANDGSIYPPEVSYRVTATGYDNDRQGHAKDLPVSATGYGDE